MDTDSAFIESLVIEKSQRGKGLGKMLVNRTEGMLKQMGFKKISLTTTNQMAFYSKLGFNFTKSHTNSSICGHSLPKSLENLIQNESNITPISDVRTTRLPLSDVRPDPPPPPLPPLPPVTFDLRLTPGLNQSQTTAKIFMQKAI